MEKGVDVPLEAYYCPDGCVNKDIKCQNCVMCSCFKASIEAQELLAKHTYGGKNV